MVRLRAGSPPNCGTGGATVHTGQRGMPCALSPANTCARAYSE